MTAKTMSAALAMLAAAAALVLWTAISPRMTEVAETPVASAEPLPDTAAATRSPEATPVLPEGLASVPRPLDALPELDASAAEPGFTIAVSTRHLRSLGQPAPPAVATLELGISNSRNDQGEPLRRFDTGPDGKAQLALPRRLVPEPVNGKRPSLWLRSQGVGLLPRTDFEPVPKDDGVTVEMSVDVQPGAIVEGRILGPDGKAVAGQVEWWFFGDKAATGSRVGSAGPDGRFRGELRFEGRHGLLAAGTSLADGERLPYSSSEQLDLGTGFSELFDVDFTQPVPFIEVRVFGPGLLQGHVRDGTGAPAAGVPMVAVLAELDDEIGSLRLPQPRSGELERMGGGHLWMHATSDADGAFAFRGMRQGLYHVRARVGQSSSGYSILLTERAVQSDGVPLALRLDRPYLAIHVREADGSVPERAIEVLRWLPWEDYGEVWPKGPQLQVTLSPQDVHVGGWRGAYLEPVAVGPGEFVAALTDNQRLAPPLEADVGLRGGELLWRPQHVVVPSGAGRVDVNLVLPPERPSGHLVLDIVDASGAALVKQVRIRVIDPATGVVLVDLPCNSTAEKDWPMRIPLPEGAHRLLVEGHPYIEHQHGTLAHRRVHGAYEQSLLITSGVDARVTVTLGAAARLAVRVVGSATEADREAFRARRAGEVPDDYVEFWAQFVELRLEREGRWPEEPLFALSFDSRMAMPGTHPVSSVPFGSEETSEPLTPGSYTLVATTTGGRVIERQVTLVPGQTISVTLPFE